MRNERNGKRVGALDVLAALGCLQASLYIASFLDGLLEESRQRELKRHVDGCEHCKRTLLIAFAHRQHALEGVPTSPKQCDLGLDHQPWLIRAIAAEGLGARPRVRARRNYDNGVS